MSSLPGLDLEDFLAWNYDLCVLGQSDANQSLAIAEAIGTAISYRPQITAEQFKPIVELFEPYRETIENRLQDFDEETQSWRDYAGYAFNFIPESVSDRALQIASTFTQERSLS